MMPIVHSKSLAAILSIAALVTPEIHGQTCITGWQNGPLTVPWKGADGPVNAIIEWSLAGQPPMLVIGGDFDHVDGITANNIAAWDGQRWSSLGTGTNGPVNALAVYNGSLIAGGAFTLAGQNPALHVAAWNGFDWSQVGTGLGIAVVGQQVCALALYDGDLIAGGRFTMSAPTSRNVARFDGTSWEAMGLGIGTDAVTVHALQTIDWDGPGPSGVSMYSGCSGQGTTFLIFSPAENRFEAIAFGSNLFTPNGPVYALTAVDRIGPMPGGIVIGGDFTAVLNVLAPSIITNDIALFTDESEAVAIGDGMSAASGTSVRALRAFGTNLYVSGRFDAVANGTVPASNIARFNGSLWSAVSAGVSGAGNTVHEMRVFNGELIVGGDFASASSLEAMNLAAWTGSIWKALWQPAATFAFTTLGNRLVAGGSFDWTNGSSAGNSYNLMAWNGLTTTRFGRGLPAPVRALTSYTTGSGPTASSVLVAGGDFLSADGAIGGPITVNRIAQWTESATIPGSWNAMGAGFDNNVLALERFNAETIAGGLFGTSGATSTPFLARWNGSAWQPFTATNGVGQTAGINLNGSVHALKTYFSSNGDLNLLIGGAFTGFTAPTNPPVVFNANRILQRTLPLVGSPMWTTLGSGLNGPVYAIERYANSIYAAGNFTIGGGPPTIRVARFTGSTWQAVGIASSLGGGFDGPVYALKSQGGFLYAAGSFTYGDNIACNNIARWNGSVWESVNTGVNDSVAALGTIGNELMAGGSFTTAGQSAAPGMARLLQSGAPWIVTQPVSPSVQCLLNANFQVAPASGYASLTYLWRKDGVPLTNGPTGHGSTIAGADSDNLVITSVRDADVGLYSCLITNACGSVTSSGASLTVGPCCVADIAPAGAPDGMVNVNDLLAVITTWGACPLPCPPGCAADISPNCAVDVNDLLAVITTWGTCP